MKRKIEYRYTSCGSTYIRYNAVTVVEWDIEEQDFVLFGTQDGVYCNSETCTGDECGTAPYDAKTVGELGTDPTRLLQPQGRRRRCIYHQANGRTRGVGVRASTGTNSCQKRRSSGGRLCGDRGMKITIHTLATDYDNGTQARVFGSKAARDGALLQWVGSNRVE